MPLSRSLAPCTETIHASCMQHVIHYISLASERSTPSCFHENQITPVPMGQTNPTETARPDTHQPIHTDKDQYQTPASHAATPEARSTSSLTQQIISTPYRLSSWPSSWWRRTGSNRRPPACKAGALPAELRPQGNGYNQKGQIWWAREDLNLRPHAYQACALTN